MRRAAVNRSSLRGLPSTRAPRSHGWGLTTSRSVRCQWGGSGIVELGTDSQTPNAATTYVSEEHFDRFCVCSNIKWMPGNETQRVIWISSHACSLNIFTSLDSFVLILKHLGTDYWNPLPYILIAFWWLIVCSRPFVCILYGHDTHNTLWQKSHTLHLSFFMAFKANSNLTKVWQAVSWIQLGYSQGSVCWVGTLSSGGMRTTTWLVPQPSLHCVCPNYLCQVPLAKEVSSLKCLIMVKTKLHLKSMGLQIQQIRYNKLRSFSNTLNYVY